MSESLRTNYRVISFYSLSSRSIIREQFFCSNSSRSKAVVLVWISSTLLLHVLSISLTRWFNSIKVIYKLGTSLEFTWDMRPAIQQWVAWELIDSLPEQREQILSILVQSVWKLFKCSSWPLNKDVFPQYKTQRTAYSMHDFLWLKHSFWTRYNFMWGDVKNPKFFVIFIVGIVGVNGAALSTIKRKGRKKISEPI